MESGTTVLISGAGIAGPALAYWLGRYGFDVTVVERAPAPRDGGHAVDFRGAPELSVLRRMGILDEIRRHQTGLGETTFVDQTGKKLVSLPASFVSGEVEILRGDLSRVLYDHSKESARYVFGDSVTSLAEQRDGVRITFERHQPRTFDLVVGADGLHSNVRALAFGEESSFVHDSGYYAAVFTAANHLNLDHAGRYYNVAGKLVGIYSARHNTEARALLVFASPPLDYDRRDVEQQKRIVADTYAGVGWEAPRVIAAMWGAPDFYFDSISQVRMDRFVRGRVALLGDAGYGATLGGLGTGLAVVCAYVLAGELAIAGGDFRSAFARYEEQIREYAKGCQKVADGAGPFLAPRTRSRIRLRNVMYRLLSSRPVAGYLNRLTTKAASAITLSDYEGQTRAVTGVGARSARAG